MNLAGAGDVETGMTTSALRLGAAATLALLLAACGGGGGTASPATTTPATTGAPTSAPATGTAAQITIASFSFGSPLTVKPGQDISVKNNDGVEHTVTADDGKSFDVSVGASGTASFTAPSKTGTYTFHCSIHPQMKGTLLVQG